VEANSSVLIFGDGPVGASLTRFAKLIGAKPVIVAGHHDDRLQMASRMGADYVINTTNDDLRSLAQDIACEGLDYIIDAVGRNDLMNEALPLLTNHGKFCIYGVASTQHLNFDWSKGPYHWTIEHMILPTFPIEAATHEPILDWIRLGFIDPGSLVSHVFGMEEISRVFEMIERREVFKGVIRIKD
jgi:threonine dehydrogenase-like Zn-dependent dehydrogenase